MKRWGVATEEKGLTLRKVKWAPPMEGFVKINSDGSLNRTMVHGQQP